jgi:hypothetical protein
MHVRTDSLFLGTLNLYRQIDRLQQSRSNIPILCRLGIFLAFVCLFAALDSSHISTEKWKMKFWAKSIHPLAWAENVEENQTPDRSVAAQAASRGPRDMLPSARLYVHVSIMAPIRD